MADVLFATPRLVLRRFRDSDLDAWHRHMNTPAVRARLGGVTSVEESTARFRRQQASWTDEGGGWLAIERAADQAFLGNCGFGPIKGDAAPGGLRGQPEIGWGLRADGWGQGYATEAAAALMAAMFERWGFATVFAQTSEANRPSWRVMERLGMERLAHLDYHDPLYPPDENPTKIYGLARA